MKTIEKASKNFKKYAASIESEILSMMFELLDIINAKTQTLRYLMELHLQIKTVAAINFNGDKRKPADPGPPTLFDECLSETKLSELFSRDELFGESCEELNSTHKSSLCVIKEHTYGNEKLHSENKTKEVEQVKHKHREDVTAEAKKFMTDLIETAIDKVETRCKNVMYNKSQLKPKQNQTVKKNFDLFEDIEEKEDIGEKDDIEKKEDIEEKEDISKEKHNVEIRSNPANPTPPLTAKGTQPHMSEGYSNDKYKYLLNDLENTTFRTVINSRGQLYQENNSYKSKRTNSESSSSSTISHLSDVDVHFECHEVVSNTANIHEDEFHEHKRDNNQMDEFHKDDIEKDQFHEDGIQMDESPTNGIQTDVTLQDKKQIIVDYQAEAQARNLFPEFFSNVVDLMPRSTRSSSVISENIIPPRRSIKKKSRKAKINNLNMSKIVLDQFTYKRICYAIRNAITKKDSPRTKPKKATKTTSNVDLETIVKEMFPVKSLEDELQRFFLKKARVMPANQRTNFTT